MKTCKSCNISQSVDNYYLHNGYKDKVRPSCKTCVKLQVKEYDFINQEKYKQRRENWLATNKRTYKHPYNKEYRNLYYLLNREKIRKAQQTYEKNNTHVIAAIKAKRRASKIKRTPKWLTADHFEQIKMIYLKAKEITQSTGIPHHVDHIIPLQGKEVSGLHVPWNLRIIPATENLRKYNKLEQT
jgi:hypothetical protein